MLLSGQKFGHSIQIYNFDKINGKAANCDTVRVVK